jgi:hypothetical protein
MIIRALDAYHDWTFGKGKQDYLRGQNAVMENIQTRLLSFFNDCFFDLRAGIDWFRLLGTKDTEKEIELSCKAVILGSYGVVRMNTISVSVLRSQRKVNLEYNIDTVYSSRVSQTIEVGNV